ncbi:MAG: DNA repair protein RecO [Candidatus Cloacimonadota bacterium]|nr:MAG: DNA repair protein RecO [Candidatus Cloacimonadota bacterium]
MSKQIICCNAFILRVINHSETSQIIHFFTDRFGHISAIAKGSRRPKSKFLGYLEQLNEVEIVVYYKEQGLSILTEISLITSHLALFKTFSKSVIINAAVEVYLQLLFSDEEVKKFYLLLKNFLEYLHKVEKNEILILWRFLLRITYYLGFPLHISSCVMCGTRDISILSGVSFLNNGIICQNCEKNIKVNHYNEIYSEKVTYHCSKEALAILSTLKNISEKINNLNMSKQTIREITAIFKIHFSNHLHKDFHLNSLKLFY